jgi:hypothetical protein
MTSLTQLTQLNNIKEEDRSYFVKYGRMPKTGPSRKRTKYFDSADREIEKARQRNKPDLNPISESTEASPRTSSIAV